jgi:hypothetical protein
MQRTCLVLVNLINDLRYSACVIMLFSELMLRFSQGLLKVTWLCFIVYPSSMNV